MTDQEVIEAIDNALMGYTPGIDRAVRFLTIDQVDLLAEFYLHTSTPPQITDAMVDAALLAFDKHDAPVSDAGDFEAMRAALAAAMGVR